MITINWKFSLSVEYHVIMKWRNLNRALCHWIHQSFPQQLSFLLKNTHWYNRKYLQHVKYYHPSRLQHILNDLVALSKWIYLAFGHRCHIVVLEIDGRIPIQKWQKVNNALCGVRQTFKREKKKVKVNTNHKKRVEILQNWVYFYMKYPLEFYLL